MAGVAWTELAVLAGLMVTCFGYLARQLNRVEDRLGDRIAGVDDTIDRLDERLSAKIDRLEERYVRHLELHAGPNA